MAVDLPIVSTLNPNAPLFLPALFLATEDFSPEWWRLVQTAPSFREFWLNERFLGDGESLDLMAEELDELAVLDDVEDLELAFHDLEDLQDSGLLTDVENISPTDAVPVSRADDQSLNLSSVLTDLQSPRAKPYRHVPIAKPQKPHQIILGNPKKNAMQRIHQPR
eukprot:c21999_g1_i1 orf=620-1114(-)